MMQSTVAAPTLSPLNGKPILLNFDGAEMSSDAGLTLLREVERRHDPRPVRDVAAGFKKWMMA